MDWTLVGTVTGLVVAVVVAILQKRGKAEAAKQAQEVGSILISVIHGVERAGQANPSLKGTKAFITAAAADAGVQDKLAGIVSDLFPKKTA